MQCVEGKPARREQGQADAERCPARWIDAPPLSARAARPEDALLSGLPRATRAGCPARLWPLPRAQREACIVTSFGVAHLLDPGIEPRRWISVNPSPRNVSGKRANAPETVHGTKLR